MGLRRFRCLEDLGDFQGYFLLDRGDSTTLFLRKGRDNPQEVSQVCFSQKVNHISPRDAEQAAFLHSLQRPDIHMAVCTGAAGTGKTLLSVAYAIDMVFGDNQVQKVFMSKPAVPMGGTRAFGIVPGTLEDKFQPFLSSYEVVLGDVLGARYKTFNKFIEFVPIEYTRGMTFKDCVFILDEAQNATQHQLLTIISRMGENSKLVLLGDVDQVDIPKSGLNKLVSLDCVLKSDITSVIELTKVYRGPLAVLAGDIRKEINGNAAR